jgi:hypothetical protein
MSKRRKRLRKQQQPPRQVIVNSQNFITGIKNKAENFFLQAVSWLKPWLPNRIFNVTGKLDYLFSLFALFAFNSHTVQASGEEEKNFLSVSFRDPADKSSYYLKILKSIKADGYDKGIPLYAHGDAHSTMSWLWQKLQELHAKSNNSPITTGEMIYQAQGSIHMIGMGDQRGYDIQGVLAELSRGMGLEQIEFETEVRKIIDEIIQQPYDFTWLKVTFGVLGGIIALALIIWSAKRILTKDNATEKLPLIENEKPLENKNCLSKFFAFCQKNKVSEVSKAEEEAILSVNQL